MERIEDGGKTSALRFAHQLEGEAILRRAAANLSDGRTREARELAHVSALLALAAVTIRELAR